MPAVLITGGTGLIGSSLSRLLVNNGYNVIILSRNPLETARKHELQSGRNSFRSSGNIYYSKWNPEAKTIDRSALQEADYIVHLAGAGVAEKRWTSGRKKEILESRTHSSEMLVKALQENPNKVKAVISASAIGWYGADLTPNPSPEGEGNPASGFTETDPAANDFLGQTCLQWEQSIEPVAALGKRLVKLRLGIALSNEGGALKEFKKPLRFGLATILGDGGQVMSWVHIDDASRAYLHAIEHQEMQGVYNVVSPEPVTNRQLILSLAQQMKGKMYTAVHVPRRVLKLMLGEMSVEVLKSATVSCNKLRQSGFQFGFPTLGAALNDLVGK